MKASEAIKVLEEIRFNHGDPEVAVYGIQLECMSATGSIYPAYVNVISHDINDARERAESTVSYAKQRRLSKVQIHHFK